MLTMKTDVWTCERIFWELLPSIRRYAAVKLRERGKSLPEIGKILGVTKSAVSQYLSGKRGGELEPWMKKIVDRWIEKGCVDIMKVLAEITSDPRFRKGWECG